MKAINVKFSLEETTKAQRRSRCILYSSFNFGARWGWLVNATPRRIYLRERCCTHCIGGWVGRLDGCGKSRPHRDSIPGPSRP